MFQSIWPMSSWIFQHFGISSERKGLTDVRWSPLIFLRCDHFESALITIHTKHQVHRLSNGQKPLSALDKLLSFSWCSSLKCTSSAQQKDEMSSIFRLIKCFIIWFVVCARCAPLRCCFVVIAPFFSAHQIVVLDIRLFVSMLREKTKQNVRREQSSFICI